MTSIYGAPLPLSPGVDSDDSLRINGINTHGLSWFPRISYGKASVAGETFTPYGLPILEAPVTLTSGLGTYNVSVPGSVPDINSLGNRTATLTVGSTELTSVENSIRWAVPVTQTCIANTLLGPLELGDLPGNTLLWYYDTSGYKTHSVYRSRLPRTLDVLSDGDALLRRVSYAQDLTNDRLYCEDEGRGLIYGIWPSSPLPGAPFGSGNWPAIYVSVGCAPSLVCEEVGYIDTDGLLRLRRTNVYNVQAHLIQPDGPITLSTGTIQGNAVELLLYGQSMDYGVTVAVSYQVLDSFCLTSGPQGLALIASANSVSGPATLTLFAEEAVCPLDVNPLAARARSGFIYLPPTNSNGPYFNAVSGRLDVSCVSPQWDSFYGVGESITVRGQALDTAGVPIESAPLSLIATGAFSVDTEHKTSAGDGYAYWTVTPTSTGPGAVVLYSGAVFLTSQALNSAIGLGWKPSLFVCLGEDYSFTGTIGRRVVYVTCNGPDGFPWLGATSLKLSSQLGSFFDPQGLSGTGLGSSINVSLISSSSFLKGPTLVAVGYSPVPGDRLSATLQSGDTLYDSPFILIS